MPEWRLTNNVLENPLGLNRVVEAVIRGDLGFLLSNLTRRNVNAADAVHRLPALHWALALGRRATVRLLLARGAALHALDGGGFSPLHRAVWSSDVALVRALLFLSPYDNDLREGEEEGGGEEGKEKREEEGETNKNDREGEEDGVEKEKTPEERLPPRGKPPPPTWRAGAHRLVNLPHAATGRTPLLLAAIRGNFEVVMLLLKECGADLNAVDHSGLSALDLAALCGHKTLVARLLAESEVHHMGEEGPHVRLRQRVEDFCETAKSFQQRDELNEINQLVCMPLAVQSFAASQ